MVTATALLHDRLDLGRELVGALDARHHAQDVLGAWGVPGEVLADALSIVTELVANAIRHAEAAESPSVLELRVVAGHLYVVVHDASRREPVLQPPSEEAESGRGLLLVAALTEGAWGFVYAAHDAGKLVWARLSLPGAVPRDALGSERAALLPPSASAVGAGV